MEGWVHARLEGEAVSDLKRLAKDEQRSLSQMIRILLAEAIAARREKKEHR